MTLVLVGTSRYESMAVVKQRGFALPYVSNDMKADRDVAMAAVMQDGWALKYASVELKNDRGVVTRR